MYEAGEADGLCILACTPSDRLNVGANQTLPLAPVRSSTTVFSTKSSKKTVEYPDISGAVRPRFTNFSELSIAAHVAHAFSSKLVAHWIVVLVDVLQSRCRVPVRVIVWQTALATRAPSGPSHEFIDLPVVQLTLTENNRVNREVRRKRGYCIAHVALGRGRIRLKAKNLDLRGCRTIDNVSYHPAAAIA